MLKIARTKATSIKRGIQFFDGDMRYIKVGKFDTAITMFNAIGQLTKDEFEEALRNIYSNLKDDGIYVFDIFNLEAITDEVVSTFVMDIILQKNGFQVLEQYDMNGHDFTPPKNINILTIVKKLPV